ncbi:MAG TPA: hypothetical protein VHO90_00015, partial [Bacteroidales bacterium]|nr:hypothetical protein [Bacteroidales bacterium]
TSVSVYFEYQKGGMAIAAAIFRKKRCDEADVGVSISLKNSIAAVARLLSAEKKPHTGNYLNAVDQSEKLGIAQINKVKIVWLDSFY